MTDADEQDHEDCGHSHLTREQYLEKWGKYLEESDPESVDHAAKFLHDVVLMAVLSISKPMLYRLDGVNGDKLTNETVDMLLDVLSSEFFIDDLSAFLLPGAHE